MKFYWLRMEGELVRYDAPYSAGVQFGCYRGVYPREYMHLCGVHIEIENDTHEDELFLGNDIGEYLRNLTKPEFEEFLEGMESEMEDV